MRAIQTILCGTILATGVAVASGAGPIQPSEVPAISRAIIHIDVERLFESELGKFLVEHPDGLDEIRDQIGLDPLEDIRDITICLLGDEDKDIVILASVTDALEGVLKKIDAFAEEVDLDTRHRFGGDFLTFNIDDQRIGALVRESRDGYRVVLAADEDYVEIVGETIEGDRDSAQRVRARRGAIAQIFVPDLSKIPHGGDFPSQIIGKLRGVTASIGEDDGRVYVDARVELDDEDDAEDLIKMADGLRAMLRFVQGMDDEQDEELNLVIGLLEHLEIEQGGRIIELSLRLDVEQAIELIEQAD